MKNVRSIYEVQAKRWLVDTFCDIELSRYMDVFESYWCLQHAENMKVIFSWSKKDLLGLLETSLILKFGEQMLWYDRDVSNSVMKVQLFAPNTEQDLPRCAFAR